MFFSSGFPHNGQFSSVARFIVDLSYLRENLEILNEIRQKADCKIVLALKGFSLWHTFPMMRDYLDGCCASGPWEARLSHEHFGRHTLTYSPGYTAEDIDEVLPISSHLDFNSISQWQAFRAKVIPHPRFQSGKLKCGLRINPEHSTGKTALYDPCAPGSRLGITAEELARADLMGISGLHFHTLCEQDSDALESTLRAVNLHFGALLRTPQFRWLNMGGGHWITQPDYDRELLIKLIRETKELYQLEEVWLEPGEAIAINTGVLEATVLDILRNGDVENVILDVSVTAHMPDVLEMPYRPEIFGPDGDVADDAGELNYTYRLGGPTCLAGDVIGDYSFNEPLKIGDTITFDDMSHYTMVKTTMFNGVKHPDICVRHEDGSIETLRKFTYDDFKGRLG